MWPFPKKHFQWREPRAFRRTIAKIEALTSRWWHVPAAGLVVSCLLMGGWALAHLDPRNQPPSFAVALPFALLTGPLLMRFVCWLYDVFPSTVMMVDDRLRRLKGSYPVDLKFKDLASFSVFDCGAFHVLVLVTPGERQWVFGVPRTVDVSALEEFLVDRGLSMAPLVVERTLR
jgi:hypothetical protein